MKQNALVQQDDALYFSNYLKSRWCHAHRTNFIRYKRVSGDKSPACRVLLPRIPSAEDTAALLSKACWRVTDTKETPCPMHVKHADNGDRLTCCTWRGRGCMKRRQRAEAGRTRQEGNAGWKRSPRTSVQVGSDCTGLSPGRTGKLGHTAWVRRLWDVRPRLSLPVCGLLGAWGRPAGTQAGSEPVFRAGGRAAPTRCPDSCEPMLVFRKPEYLSQRQLVEQNKDPSRLCPNSQIRSESQPETVRGFPLQTWSLEYSGVAFSLRPYLATLFKTTAPQNSSFPFPVFMAQNFTEGQSWNEL